MLAGVLEKLASRQPTAVAFFAGRWQFRVDTVWRRQRHPDGLALDGRFTVTFLGQLDFTGSLVAIPVVANGTVSALVPFHCIRNSFRLSHIVPMAQFYFLFLVPFHGSFEPAAGSVANRKPQNTPQEPRTVTPIHLINTS